MLHLFRAIFGGAEKAASPYDDEVIDWATEKLVDGTDTRLRVVSGYKRKLRPCIERSVGFVIEAVESLPPPLMVDPGAFSTNHEIRTWFGTIQNLHEAFSLSLPVQAFAASPEGGSLTHFFAGMRTAISQKTVFVSEMQGEVIRRDVARTAFSFINHSVVAPAATEEALRLEVKERAYMNLVELALAGLFASRRRESGLEKQRALLQSKLRTLKSGDLGIAPIDPVDPGGHPDVATIEAKLDRIESELGGTSSRPGALDRSLECIVDVMNAPEDRIRITSETVRVTQMGLLADDNTSEHCDEVGYTKVDMGDSESAAIRLVAFPIADLQPMERFRPRL